MKTAIKYINIFQFILFGSLITTLSVSAQTPQMRLNSQEFKPAQFTPTPYTAPTQDNSILERSLQNRENRANNAVTGLSELRERCAEIKSQIAPSDYEWFQIYEDSVCGRVEEEYEAGNYQSAARLASDYKSRTYYDKEIRYRIDSYKLYCDEMSSHSSSYTNGKVNEGTYQYWLYKNQYQFNPKFDESGDIIGFNQQTVTWLYPNIDWQDAYVHITQNGKTKEQVENMWRFYFSFGGDRSGSLRQEYEVAEFYFRYYVWMLENEELTQGQRDQLNSDIKQINSIIIGENGEPSFDAYVKNLQIQMMK